MQAVDQGKATVGSDAFIRVMAGFGMIVAILLVIAAVVLGGAALTGAIGTGAKVSTATDPFTAPSIVQFRNQRAPGRRPAMDGRSVHGTVARPVPNQRARGRRSAMDRRSVRRAFIGRVSQERARGSSLSLRTRPFPSPGRPKSFGSALLAVEGVSGDL